MLSITGRVPHPWGPLRQEENKGSLPHPSSPNCWFRSQMSWDQPEELGDRAQGGISQGPHRGLTEMGTATPLPVPGLGVGVLVAQARLFRI